MKTLFCIVLAGIFSFSGLGHCAEVNLAGIRGVQIRSASIVTVWLGYEATDSSLLYDTSLYAITSPDDPAYQEPVHPVHIARFSKGSRSANGPFDWRVLQDQFMHLTVEASFRPGHTYVVTLAEGLIPRNHPHTVQFRLDETPNPGFKLNQVGYTHTATKKLVYLSSYLGDGIPVDLSQFDAFEVRDAATDETVLSGPVTWVSDKDLQGNDTLYVLDISNLKENGSFYVWIDGFGRSYTFLNGQQAAQEMYDIISHGMYFQRCGTDIVPPFAEKWPRPMSHQQVYVPNKRIVHPWDIKVDPADPNAGDYYVPNGPLEIHGGHHDAGDFDTRLTHLAVPEKLMTLYEARPDNFRDGQVKIPENSNGIPDVLDEAAWNMLHYEYLQDYHGQVQGEFGAVPPGMESWKHPPLYPTTGDGDPLPYYARKATPYTTFCAAAVFAQAARVFRPFDSERAAAYLNRSKAAYAWAVDHRDEIWDPENPKVLPLDWEEVYDHGKLAAAQCWAAGHLFVTTLETTFWDDVVKHYPDATETSQGHKWSVVYPLLYHTHSKSDDPLVDLMRNEFTSAADRDLELVRLNGENGYYAICRNEGDWGSANPIANLELLAKAYLLTGKQAYRNAVATSVDFTLGMNPSELSWMTGAGDVYVMDPLSINSKYDGIEEPLPGIVIFGPGDSWNHPQNVLYPDAEHMGFYRRIADVWSYVQGCEYVVDEQQANMVLATGILLK